LWPNFTRITAEPGCRLSEKVAIRAPDDEVVVPLVNGMDDEPSRRFSPLLGPEAFPPLSARVQVEFGAATRRGPRRVQNADHHLIVRLARSQETVLTSLPPAVVPLPFDESGFAMVVADGEAEAASRLALSTLVHLALHFGKWNLRIDYDVAREVMDRIERFYRQVDGVVSDRRLAEPVWAGMHTTMTAVMSAGRDCFIAHVGHSRAYLYREGELMPVTRDHTVDSARGRLATVTAVAADLQHALTDCIGHGGAGVRLVDVEHFRLLDDDRLLLCTNGLTDATPDSSLAAVLGGDLTPADQSRTLVDMALDAGGTDDATAVIARYHIPA